MLKVDRADGVCICVCVCARESEKRARSRVCIQIQVARRDKYPQPPYILNFTRPVQVHDDRAGGRHWDTVGCGAAIGTRARTAILFYRTMFIIMIAYLCGVMSVI